MKNSRNIDDLRPDVAKNCKIFLGLCERAGLAVLVTGTVRDTEYQEQCYKNGTAKTKTPSFHSVKAGLAFDICQNIKGKEYSNKSFFKKAAKIAKKIGFSWGGDWETFPDLPHFQWDDFGRYTSSMIRRGVYPPEMPKFEKDGAEMTQEQFNKMMDTYLASRDKLLISKWAAGAVDWAYNSGILTADENKNIKPGQFVTREQLATILYRLKKEP